MGKTKCLMTALLILVLSVLIEINLVDRDNSKKKINDVSAPTYKSDYSDMLIYDKKGALHYHLFTKHIEYFSKKGISWFTKPVVTMFDTNKVPIWLIQSNKAKLTNDHILYLYGHVEINALTSDTKLRRIIANNAKINLITQDVVSQDLVELYGTKFSSSALKMRGNLHTKNAELFEQVKTFYEIQKK